MKISDEDQELITEARVHAEKGAEILKEFVSVELELDDLNQAWDMLDSAGGILEELVNNAN